MDTQPKSKVRLDASFTADEARTYCREMLDDLKDILRQPSIDEMYHLIEKFKDTYAEQEEFLDYFESQWCTESMIPM